MAERRATNDTVRRTWDDETFTQRAKQRAALEEQEGDGLRKRRVPLVPSAQRVELGPRAAGERLDADAIAGSTVVIPDGAQKSNAGGFYCKHCDVLSHDSSAYLNHMNSRAHQAVLGFSMQVKRSTAADVRRAFAEALERRKEREAAFGKPPLTLDELLQRRKARDAASRAAKRAEKLRDAETALTERGEGSNEEDAARAEEMRRAGLPTSF